MERELHPLHVAPLPAGHEASELCWCVPVKSIEIADQTLYVHRIGTAARRVAVSPPDEMGRVPWPE